MSDDTKPTPKCAVCGTAIEKAADLVCPTCRSNAYDVDMQVMTEGNVLAVVINGTPAVRLDRQGHLHIETKDEKLTGAAVLALSQAAERWQMALASAHILLGALSLKAEQMKETAADPASHLILPTQPSPRGGFKS